MAKHFVGIWLIYWAVIALLPVHSIYPATLEAFALQCTFVALVLVAYTLAYAILGASALPAVGRFDLPTTPKLIRIALGMSIIGFFFLIYDKIYIQGIDFSDGIAVAREEWRRVGEDREGQVSSIFSVLGYLMGSGYYVAAVLAVTQVKVLSARKRVWVLLGCFVLLMVNSAITGGRSNVLLIAVFIIGALAARGGLNLQKLFDTPAQRRIVLVAAGLALIYTLFIFYQRAQASDVSSQEYALDFLPFLGLETDEWYRGLMDGSAVSSLSAVFVLAVSYLTHSFASVAAIIGAPSEEKTIIFLHIGGILNKLGLVNPPDADWFLAGRFPSFPGALWHQYGAIGFVLGSLLLGTTSAIANAWTARQPARLLPLGVFVMVYGVLLLTPALFAADFLSFPFAAAAFVIISLIDRYLRSHTVLRTAPKISRYSAASPSTSPSNCDS